MSNRRSLGGFSLALLALAALSCQLLTPGGAATPTEVPEAAATDADEAAEPTDVVIEDGSDDITIGEGDATSEPADTDTEFALDEGYQDPAGFYAIDYPAEWVASEFSAGVHLWADESGQVGLDVSPEVKYVSPEAIADDFSAFFSERLDGYEELGRAELELSGLPALWVDMQYEYDGDPVRGFMATVVRDRAGYLLFGYAPEADYADQEATLRAMVNSLALTDFEDAPLYDTWETYASDNIDFYYLPDTYVADDIEAIAEAHEQALVDNAGWLGVDYEGPRIQFFFYPDDQALHLATGRDSGFSINDFAHDAAEVHSIWTAEDDHQSIGHELTHVITSWTLGDAGQALLGEGVAVCLDGGDTPVHVRASEYWASDELVPLADMLGDQWFEQDPAVAYTESGSVACWLLERYDLDSFQQLFPREDFEDALQEIYGFDLDYLEEDWLTMLSNN